MGKGAGSHGTPIGNTCWPRLSEQRQTPSRHIGPRGTLPRKLGRVIEGVAARASPFRHGRQSVLARGRILWREHPSCRQVPRVKAFARIRARLPRWSHRASPTRWRSTPSSEDARSARTAATPCPRRKPRATSLTGTPHGIAKIALPRSTGRCSRRLWRQRCHLVYACNDVHNHWLQRHFLRASRLGRIV